jgi:N-acetylneuraminic acid mutarotase
LSSETLAILGGVIPEGDLVNTTDIMQLYDIPSNTWSDAPSIPLPMNHANVAVVEGKIYLLGGLSVDAAGAWVGEGRSWAYDPKDNEWTSIASMPNGTERGSAAMGVHGKNIYLAGGMTILDVPGGGYQDSVATVSVYDTKKDTWKVLPQELPEGRDHAGGSVVGSTLYVLGGRNFGSTNNRDTVFSLRLHNPKATWKTSKSRMPTARGGVSAATVGKKVHIFGGEGNEAEGSHGVFNETEVFDTKTETWKTLQPMKLPRHGTSAIAVKGKIYIPGGGIYENAGPVNTFDVFCPGH